VPCPSLSSRAPLRGPTGAWRVVGNLGVPVASFDTVPLRALWDGNKFEAGLGRSFLLFHSIGLCFPSGSHFSSPGCATVLCRTFAYVQRCVNPDDGTPPPAPPFLPSADDLWVFDSAFGTNPMQERGLWCTIHLFVTAGPVAGPYSWSTAPSPWPYVFSRPLCFPVIQSPGGN
jgi:hypothetical protein